jgi:hypothetical protein
LSLFNIEITLNRIKAMQILIRIIVYMIKYDNTKSGNVSSVGKTAMCKKRL